MTHPIPKRLQEEPLIEAIWHLTYRLSAPAVGDVLVGVLYAALKERGRRYEVHRVLPVEIPAELAEEEPTLRYAVKYQLKSAESSVLYLIGDRVVSLNCQRPYIGWQRLREEIAFLKGVLQRSELILPERHGLRYIDLIRKEYMPDLSGLQIQVSVGQEEIRTQPVQLQVELAYREKKHTVRILSPVKAEIDAQTWEGTLIDLEVGGRVEKGWDAISEDELDELHRSVNLLFFTQILTPELLHKLRPQYEEL